MIGVITETKYSIAELQELQAKKCIVNYTLLPAVYDSYNKEIRQINLALINKAKALIFRVENFYAGTKEAIELALLKHKTIRVITPEKSYIIRSIDEWRYTHYENTTSHTRKHEVLLMFEEQRRAYYEAIHIAKEKERYTRLTDGLDIDKETIESFVRALAPQYKLDVNYDDFASICQAYKTLLFYYDNNFSYDLDQYECFVKGAIDPDESEYFNSTMFKINTDYEFPVQDLTSFGDATYMEDYIYKNIEHTI